MFSSTMEFDRAKISDSVQELVVQLASPRIEVLSSIGNSSASAGASGSSGMSNTAEGVATNDGSGCIVELLREEVGEVGAANSKFTSPG